jgi:hypothetical protein
MHRYGLRVLCSPMSEASEVMAGENEEELLVHQG